MSVLETVCHAHSVHLYELLEDGDNFYIVTELAREGDLYHFFKDRQDNDLDPIPEEQAKFVAKQLFSVVHSLHEKQVIHRDIKLENILISGFKS